MKRKLFYDSFAKRDYTAEINLIWALTHSYSKGVSHGEEPLVLISVYNEGNVLTCSLCWWWPWAAGLNSFGVRHKYRLGMRAISEMSRCPAGTGLNDTRSRQEEAVTLTLEKKCSPRAAIDISRFLRECQASFQTTFPPQPTAFLALGPKPVSDWSVRTWLIFTS